ANTQLGWGAVPDPFAYANLFEAVLANLNETENAASEGSPAKEPVVLVAAGLVPVSSPDAANMDDLLYLKQFYAAGAAEFMTVLSLRFPALTGEPLANPRSSDAQVLRHYELIRSIMLENAHSKGLIWVTGFSWPAALADGNPGSEKDSSSIALENNQSHWLNNAHQQMKSQLYLGVAIYDCLNPPGAGIDQSLNDRCLVRVDQGKANLHPALESIGYIYTLLNKQQTQASRPGPGGLSVPVDIKAAWKSAVP
ncbi:MAG: hypothetical protein ACWGO1_09300, partial [Anaerolineales bacterium]